MPEPSEQQFPDQDRPGGSQQPTSGSSAAAGPTGNRPAGGAPVMRPDEMADDEWGSKDNAQDFLGLDGQPNHRPDTSGGEQYQAETGRETGSALADAPELEEGEFENWLEDDSEDSASWLMELDEQPSEDVFDPERLETEFGIQPSATASSRGGWILRVTLVAAGLGAGFVGARWYGDQQLRSGGETTVAHVQTTAPVTTTNNTNGSNGTTDSNSGANGNANTSAPNKPNNTASKNGTPKNNTAKNNQHDGTKPNGGASGTKPDTTAVATAPTATNPGATVTTNQPTVDTTPSTGNGGIDTTPDPFFPNAPGPASTGPETEPVTGTQPTTGNGKSFTMPVEDMVVVPRVESPVRFASEADLAAVWNQREIPLDRIASSERMLTPQVGRVRLFIHGGEIFEGRLYAVGQNKVWLDTGLGKMALLGWQVDRIEHLADKVASTLGAKGSEDLTGLQRVRVRTPGGVFYGKLLDQDQGNVTLITEDGGRIRLANARVEPAGKSRTRIVDPGKAKAQEAASKPE